jgi:transcriptional regulator with XRE-family HTH domain/quercetin dioxygenase-like cupin family protein
VYDDAGEVNEPLSKQADPPIGQRIREERLRRGYNLRTLARAVNVSASHISQIETGKCRPSVSILYAITTVLGVSIDDIFEGPGADELGLGAEAGGVGGAGEAQASSAGVPAGRALPWPSGPGQAGSGTPGQGAAAALVALASEHARRVGPVVGPGERETLELDSGVTWERLGHVPGLHVDFLLITYAPGGSSSSTDQLMRHPGTEYGYLISGELVVTLGFSEHKVVPGDAICFPSSTPHRYRNEGTEQAVGVWFVANPDAL